MNMEHSSEEDSAISKSEIDLCVEKVYQQLQAGTYRVRISDFSFQCPFCLGKRKKDYQYKDLVQHATRRGSFNGQMKDQANHRALTKFLNMDLSEMQGPSQLEIGKEKQDYQHKDHVQHASGCGACSGQRKDLANHQRLTKFSNMDLSEVQGPPQSKTEQEPSHAARNEEQFVWPWMIILVNLSTEFKDGKYIGEGVPVLRERYSQFNPVKICPLWNFRGHTGNAVLDFGKDWFGFKNAMACANSFEVNFHGRKQWNERKHCGTTVYGWVAGPEDYKSSGAIGNHLRKNGDLRTVSDLEKEGSRKADKLVTKLADAIDEKDKNLKILEIKYHENTLSLNEMIKEKDWLNQTYNDEIKRLQDPGNLHLDKVYCENEKQRIELDIRRKELELRSQESDKKEAQNDSERRKLDDEKQKHAAINCSLESASLEQQKADESVLRLLEEQQKAREQVLDKMIQVERQLDAKQKLELGIEQLKGSLQVLQYMGCDDDSIQNKMEEMKRELEDKVGEMEYLEQLNQALIVKERKSNDELQDAYKELLTGLKGLGNVRHSIIGIKKMGELDKKPFQTVCKRKYPAAEADDKAAMMCSKWEEYISDPGWHPFKVIRIKSKTNENEAIIDEDDERLKALKTDWGEDVYNAVTRALHEVNQYNPTGRYTVPELWNFKEDRKAPMEEVILYIIKRWKLSKQRKML